MGYLNVVVGENLYSAADVIPVCATLVVSLLIGVYYGVKNKNTNEELLVGGRNMGFFPVMASLITTYISARTMLGFPSAIYARGGQSFVIDLVAAVGIPISGYLFVPFFYEMKLTSINEYLERRFESKWVRWLASGLFIVQQLTLSAVVLYMPCRMLDDFLGLTMWISVLGIGVCATLYASIGGIKAVVWTNAFHLMMIIIGLIALIWKGISGAGGFINAIHLANDRGRLQFFDLTFDPFTRDNFWNILIGTGFYSIMHPGTHQLQVQRYSGMASVDKAKQVIIGSGPLKLFVMFLYLLTGIAIFAFYANCDPITSGHIQKPEKIVPYFVKNELSRIPGMIGIFTSCIFSGILSYISSSINSLAAVTWEDFLVRRKYYSIMSPAAQTSMTRLCCVVYGTICIVLAFIIPEINTISNVASNVIGATAGALYGVFLMGMFMPFVNSAGAILGALTGLICTIVLNIGAFINKEGSKSMLLLLSVEQCPVNPFNNLSTPELEYETTPMPAYEPTSLISEEDWQAKIFQFSSLLYPVMATALSISVGVLISLLSCICVPSYRKKVPHSSLVHPLVRSFCGCCTIRETRHYDEYEDKGERMEYFEPMLVPNESMAC